MSPTTSTESRNGGAAVDIVDVTHLYQGNNEQVVALRDVNLHVGVGESIALLGPSGSGKSTLLSLLAGLQDPTTGAVSIDGKRVSAAARDSRRLRRDTVGLLVQDPGRTLPPFATPMMLLRRAGDPDPAATLDRFGLGRVRAHRAATMSAGEQQRLALALVLARRPGLLLVDEPTSRLDQASKVAVLEALHAFTARAETTVVTVTHDATVAQSFPRTVTLSNGRVGTDGTYDDQLSVVAPDGSLALPASALAVLPAGSKVRVLAEPGRVQLLPAGRPTPEPEA